MPYAPTVNDRSGEILGQYTANAANIRAEGMQSFGQSIGKGLESMGSSIAGGMTKARENAIKYDTAAGMLDTYKENAGALGLDLNMLEGMEQKLAGNPDKLIGALTVVGKIGENNLDIQKAQKTYEALGNAYAGKAAATAAATTQPKFDANYGRQFYQVFRQQGKMTHEQALDEMDKAGLSWAKQYIEPQKNPFFQ
jgi:hypothetical protein